MAVTDSFYLHLRLNSSLMKKSSENYISINLPVQYSLAACLDKYKYCTVTHAQLTFDKPEMQNEFIVSTNMQLNSCFPQFSKIISCLAILGKRSNTSNTIFNVVSPFVLENCLGNPRLEINFLDAAAQKIAIKNKTFDGSVILKFYNGDSCV